MEPQYWLSLLIPIYNVETYLRECLESVLAQIDGGVEIIALDDCSTDNSLSLLQDIAQHSLHPINILRHTHNQGLSAARNSLLEIAKGDYIWFLDSDDLMEPGAMRQLKKITEEHKPDLIMCDFRVLRHQQTLKHRLRGENHRNSFVGPPNILLQNSAALFYGLYKKGELHAWSKISKRHLWGNDLRFPVNRYMEDMTTTPRLALRASTYFYCPQVWIAYRQRQGSILSTPSVKKIEDAACGNAGVLDLWLQKYPNLSNEIRLAFSHYCARTHYVVMRDLKRSKHLIRAYVQTKNNYRAQLFHNIGWTKPQLCWQYGKRGLISRLIRFLIKY